jgi:hypothetical protein
MTKKSHNGGGRTPVKVGVRTGPPNTKVVSPSGAAHIGRSVGNHAENKTTSRPPTPLVTGTKPQVPLGNAVALNVGRGGPGKGYVNHGPSGSQGQHGPAVQGSTPQPRDILSDFAPKKG